MPYSPMTSAMKTGLRERCPRCCRGKLFASYLKLAPRCNVCGLDFSFADPADGPAFFVMSIVAVPGTLLALWIEFTFAPPFWVHLLVTLPIIAAMAMALLPRLKGWFVCAEYRHKNKHGRLDRDLPTERVATDGET